MPDHQGHIFHFPEGGHGRVPGQAQNEIGACVVFRDLVDHAPVAPAAALPADEVLAVYEVCTENHRASNELVRHHASPIQYTGTV